MGDNYVLHDVVRGPLAILHRFLFLPETLDIEKEKVFKNTAFGFQCEYLSLIFLEI